MTTRAASEVTSLCWPNAMPTVAAISAGASLMPSPTNSVFAAFGLAPHDLHLLLRRCLRMDLGDRNRAGETPHFRFPIAGDEQHAREAVPGPEMLDEAAAVGARHIVETKHRGVAGHRSRRCIPGRSIAAGGRSKRPASMGATRQHQVQLTDLRAQADTRLLADPLDVGHAVTAASAAAWTMAAASGCRLYRSIAATTGSNRVARERRRRKSRRSGPAARRSASRSCRESSSGTASAARARRDP